MRLSCRNVDERGTDLHVGGSGSPSRARPGAVAFLDPASVRRADDREQLPGVLVDLMRDIGISNRIGAG
jgi:hypothetical protein